MKYDRIFPCLVIALLVSVQLSAQSTIWQIGKPDSSPNEFALAPGSFKDFVHNDFGFEDKFFLVSYSDPRKDFPYALPGPVDTWGGTGQTSGWRTNQVNILFGLKKTSANGDFQFNIQLADYAKSYLPLIKIIINDTFEIKRKLSSTNQPAETKKSPSLSEPFIDSVALASQLPEATPIRLSFSVPNRVLRKGGNCITITIIEGAWIKFDALSLSGNAIAEKQQAPFFIRKVQAADYELETEGKTTQPLLVDVQHLNNKAICRVEVDGKTLLKENVEKDQYKFEVPMPVVTTRKTSVYKIFADNQLLETGTVVRSPQPKHTLADYVDTRIGSSHSRWMIAPGPWMPFSMVKISPDNQDNGWQSGYQPNIESIGTFSHIHEWTLAGLGTFPTTGNLKIIMGNQYSTGADSVYRSAIDKQTEVAKIGYYKVDLKAYNIRAELTATTRCSFQKYTFPSEADSGRVLIDLQVPNEYPYHLKDIQVRKINDHTIEGYAHQYAPNVWSRDADQDYTVHFVMEFDSPIQSVGNWTGNEVHYNSNELKSGAVSNAGVFLLFNTKVDKTVQVRTGISLVSVNNARENLKVEISDPFGWNFEAVRINQQKVWNDIFNRIKITTSDSREKMRFYNCLYRSYCSRNIWSDVNGQWRGTDGQVHVLKNKDDVALGCDAFWNTFWNLNQVWNLITPEWSRRWVNSELAMYEAYGWLAKGPAGMNYIPVMVAEHEIPLMVSAHQMGIKDIDAQKILEAAVKMQTTPSQKLFTGYVGNRDLIPYLKYHYVPSDKGRFSNTMEYSYDDWTVGQLAKKLGNDSVYRQFNERGNWWKNAIDKDGYCHMRLSSGEWTKDFNPMRSGANHHYVEGNGWQLSYFVPQDVKELVNMIGNEKFVTRLDEGFTISEPWRYNGLHDQYWNCPVVQGNQQSMHFAFLFNWAGSPWLSQKWSRSIMERYYGYGEGNAYLGDEDQGQMSAWFVMAAIGLFQTDGGCNADPIYEIASPLYKKTVIELGERSGRGIKFTIVAENASRLNKYIQSATLNGKPLNSFYFSAVELLKGGELKLVMGDTPNKNWGGNKTFVKNRLVLPDSMVQKK